MYDVAVCSLVLIHQVNYTDFAAVVKGMCALAKTVFVFEDVTLERKTSPNTRLRSLHEIELEFKRNGYALEFGNPELPSSFQFFDDTVTFLKFVEASHSNESGFSRI